MPTQSTNIFTTGVAITFASNNLTWIIDPGVTVARANGAANGPTVAGGSKEGITLVNNGYIFNGGTGDFIDGPPYALSGFRETSKIVNNAGATISGHGYAIISTGTVENAGTIVGGFGAVEGGGLVLKNAGELFGRITVVAHNGANIQNKGLIEGALRGITVSNEGHGKTTVIDNAKAGIIKGGALPGTDMSPGAAIYSGTSHHNAVVLANKGLIDGKILLTDASASDKVVNKGKGVITGETRLGPGDDTFVFGGGKQGTVFGESGADRFDFVGKLASKKSAPVIGDFTLGEDTIGLSKKLFKGIGKEGPLKNKYFEVGKKAKDKDDRVIWDKAKGNLFYDKDGKGGDGQTLVAKLTPDIDLKAGDILVIA